MMIGAKRSKIWQKFSWLFRYVVLTSMVEPQKVPMAAADDHVVRLQPLQNVGKPSAAFSLQIDPDRHIVHVHTSFLLSHEISKTPNNNLTFIWLKTLKNKDTHGVRGLGY